MKSAGQPRIPEDRPVYAEDMSLILDWWIKGRKRGPRMTPRRRLTRAPRWIN